MAARNAPKTHGTAMPLPGLWHWLVMLPVTAFALSVCAGVLWMVVGTPLVAQVSAPNATARPLARADTNARNAVLARMIEARCGASITAVARGDWCSHVLSSRVEGDTLTLATDYVPYSAEFGASQTFEAIAIGLRRDLRALGDPVSRIVVRDAQGNVLVDRQLTP